MAGLELSVVWTQRPLSDGELGTPPALGVDSGTGDELVFHA